jgi:hypothetical protein
MLKAAGISGGINKGVFNSLISAKNKKEVLVCIAV